MVVTNFDCIMQDLLLKLNGLHLLFLFQYVCLDAGGTLGAISFVEELSGSAYTPYSHGLTSTNGAECMKHHLTECVDFVSDLHTITKIKVRKTLCGTCVSVAHTFVCRCHTHLCVGVTHICLSWHTHLSVNVTQIGLSVTHTCICQCHISVSINAIHLYVVSRTLVCQCYTDWSVSGTDMYLSVSQTHVPINVTHLYVSVTHLCLSVSHTCVCQCHIDFVDLR